MAIKSPQKFTKEELDQLQDLQTEINQLTAQFGSLQISKIRIEKNEATLKKQFSIIEEKEKKLAKILTEKYGKGSLNPETGEFTPVK